MAFSFLLSVNADCAEEFEVADFEAAIPGTVLVIAHDARLRACDEPYERRVAGVVSGAADTRPGIILAREATSTNRVPVALAGKVYCLADARFGAIEVGDLLTTSTTVGHAMKASDPRRAFGAVIGKALHSLREGRGLIPMLVALQ